jgi:hypothetical protein
MQDIQMIEWMLAVSGAVLEVAAAHYDPATGRVDRVREGKRKIASLADYERLRSWLRYENAHGSNIWIRPAAAEHPLVMLDDLPTATGAAVARKYRALAVETTRGNCQVWIACSRQLSRNERQDVSRSLCRLVGSDTGAISEPRWGRLAGYRQRKPGKEGFLTTIIEAAALDRPPLDPAPHLETAPSSRPAHAGGGGVAYRGSVGSTVGDESRREFAFACHALRRGMSPDEVGAAIAAHVAASGRRKSRDYAVRTVAAALARLQFPAIISSLAVVDGSRH